MSEHDYEEIVLWRCPACGKVEPNTGQSARYCGATKACIKRPRTDLVETTPMERWVYRRVRREAERG